MIDFRGKKRTVRCVEFVHYGVPKTYKLYIISVCVCLYVRVCVREHACVCMLSGVCVCVCSVLFQVLFQNVPFPAEFWISGSIGLLTTHGEKANSEECVYHVCVCVCAHTHVCACVRVCACSLACVCVQLVQLIEGR